ncbi:Hypothetical predicted protein [Lecanosticta acicola]|uniref:Uncharacterized protein n=1 Tax=Lecanosticta acicola TaxID=111012 RepID=A0AAI9E4N7_9PEZI|nr:Hypothetical predicted protein [Lecanosticta acicola]
MAADNLGPPKDITVYIFDACEPPGEGGKFRHITSHEQKQGNLEALFKDYIDCKAINLVRFPRGTRAGELRKYVKAQMKDKGSNDLVLIYFHGKGAWALDGATYHWEFRSSYPKNGTNIDGFGVIQESIDSGVDTIYWIDADFPNRFKKTLKASKHAENPGNVQIIARGGVRHTSTGDVIEGGAGDSTWEICVNLGKLVDEINTPTVGKVRGYDDYKEPLSLVELLGRRDTTVFKPMQKWIRPSRGDKKPVLLFLMVPDDIRKTGKIRLFPKYGRDDSEDGQEDVQEHGLFVGGGEPVEEGGHGPPAPPTPAPSNCSECDF